MSWNLRTGPLKEKEKNYNSQNVLVYTYISPEFFEFSFPEMSLFTTLLLLPTSLLIFNVLAKVKRLLLTLEIILKPFLFISLWLGQTLVHNDPCLKWEG